jgi:hypothetical protein
MRGINAWPVSGLKLVWERLTFSPLTIAYFTFTVLHFIIQVSFQIKAFTINASAGAFLRSIAIQGAPMNESITILDGDKLRLCSVGSILDTAACPIVWDGSLNPNATFQTDLASNVPFEVAQAVAPENDDDIEDADGDESDTESDDEDEVEEVEEVSPPVSPPGSPEVFPAVPPAALPPVATVVSPIVSPAVLPPPTRRFVSEGQFPTKLNGFLETGPVSVNINGPGFDNVDVTLDSGCLSALNYPLQTLWNTQREDLVFITFQFWVLCMSIVALLNESIPHIIAGLVTHVMATSWSAAQLTYTETFRVSFNRIITQGACGGVSFLAPDFWKARAYAEIPILALNAFGLLVGGLLSWRLLKLYGWQTFKRIGASLTINRVYKLVLMLSIAIQLALYFIVVTVALWLDQLLNSSVGDKATFLTIYKAGAIITLVLLVPWVLTGWFGVRRELRLPMLMFLLFSILYLGGWGVMFFSTTFRWTFSSWRFFAVKASASVFLTVTCFLLGVICRINFGKGLVRYMNAQESLPDDDFVYDNGSDIEKVDYPSNEKAIPTYSAAFGSGPEVPPPSRWFPANIGPRFFNKSAQPFDNRQKSPISPPVAALARVGTNGSSNSSIMRTDSRKSDRSVASYRSDGSTYQPARRFVIE